ncbi:MAG: hypothetical protein QOI58_1622 [Thermoanaerobaculia bacterium]|nr:hypothetical protein [Thermoanaerobaculia bacterium]
MRNVDSCRKARHNIRLLLRPSSRRHRLPDGSSKASLPTRGATSLPPLALKKSRSKNGFARPATVGSASSICSSTSDVYAEQLGRADTEIGTDQQALAALRCDAIDADAATDYALGLAAAPGQRWQSGSLPAKQRLQQVFFPKRLQFEDGEFRTSELGFLFKHLRANREPDSRLVAHTGFEPVLPP